MIFIYFPGFIYVLETGCMTVYQGSFDIPQMFQPREYINGLGITVVGSSMRSTLEAHMTQKVVWQYQNLLGVILL